MENKSGYSSFEEYVKAMGFTVEELPEDVKAGAMQEYQSLCKGFGVLDGALHAYMMSLGPDYFRTHPLEEEE